MIDRKALLADLRRQLKRLEQDLAERSESVQEMKSALEAEYRAARDAERTGDTFQVWRAGALTQAAVAWLLACVFVRFVEDNGLVDAALIAGSGERNARAADRQTLYFHGRPTDTDRDYLLDVFAEIARLPGMARLYDPEHNPVWRRGISGDAARDLLAFWRAVDPDTGVLRHDFTDSEWGTRFLGDIYQDISEDARKRFALLQTPEFVEEFILDRTLTPALDEFGITGLRLIDPACGSGHFLLGAFPRLLREWLAREPGTPERVLVQRALDGVYGVDINPFATAIARFRLLVAALRASRVTRLQEAPNFRIHVTAGDSLLHGRRFDELDLGSGAEQMSDRGVFRHAYLAEDIDDLNRILGQRYHVVIGNPPYVTVKDRAANQLYRARYRACHMKYALSVPFAERFFDLALRGTAIRSAGYVGQITSNSFMKREFGRKLIEVFFPSADLTHVIDTSGAYIPGHGTPTVILLGRNRPPTADHVRAVLGIRGEPETPANPASAKVWRAVVAQVDRLGSESEWIITSDVSRQIFHRHPWNLSGSKANDLSQQMEGSRIRKLANVIEVVGIFGMTNADGVMLASSHVWRRRKVNMEYVRPVCVGDEIRDWELTSETSASFPYSAKLQLIAPDEAPNLLSWLWTYRTILGCRATFSKLTYFQEGRPWYEWHQVALDRLRVPLSITFAFVATHNHFVIDRGDRVFNRSAPVIKLPADATESEYLGLAGLLNSSIACFWMKQTLHNKGGGGIGGGLASEEWEQFYEYTGTGLKQFPLPTKQPTKLAKVLERLAIERYAHLPAQLASSFPLTPAELDAHRNTAAELLARMISLQEELDWECYRLYDIIDENCHRLDEARLSVAQPMCAQRTPLNDFHDDGSPGGADTMTAPVAPSSSVVARRPIDESYASADKWVAIPEQSLSLESATRGGDFCTNVAERRREPPPLALGERAFEIVMAQRMAEGELETKWFARHRSNPIAELPAHWADDYRTLVEQRIELIKSKGFINLVERPEYKRRWNVEPWQDQEQRALRNWMLGRLESPAYWPEPRLLTVRILAERTATDADFQQVTTRYVGHVGIDLGRLVADLVESESVPVLPTQRYRASGLAKRNSWEQTWAQQRREDEIDAEVIATTPRLDDETEEDHVTRLRAEQRHRKQTEIGDPTPPPKYRAADFLKATYWRLRGGLDVPKERFVSFPQMSRDNDPTLLVGWAGWNVLELCQAVAAYASEVIEQDGWPPERLTPLLAVLQENLPWLKQWHNEVDPEYNQRLGDFFETYLQSQLSIHGLTEDDLRAWTPPGIERRRRTTRRTGNADGPAVPDRSAQSTG